MKARFFIPGLVPIFRLYLHSGAHTVMLIRKGWILIRQDRPKTRSFLIATICFLWPLPN